MAAPLLDVKSGYMLTVQNHRKQQTSVVMVNSVNLVDIGRLYTEGNVVLMILNLNKMKASVELKDHELASSQRDVYWMTPPGGMDDLQSK